MKEPKVLTDRVFLDAIQIPDGYDRKSVPALTRYNLQTLIDAHNNLVEVVNMLCDKHGIVFDN